MRGECRPTVIRFIARLTHASRRCPDRRGRRDFALSRRSRVSPRVWPPLAKSCLSDASGPANPTKLPQRVDIRRQDDAGKSDERSGREETYIVPDPADAPVAAGFAGCSLGTRSSVVVPAIGAFAAHADVGTIASSNLPLISLEHTATRKNAPPPGGFRPRLIVVSQWGCRVAMHRGRSGTGPFPFPPHARCKARMAEKNDIIQHIARSCPAGCRCSRPELSPPRSRLWTCPQQRLPSIANQWVTTIWARYDSRTSGDIVPDGRVDGRRFHMRAVCGP